MTYTTYEAAIREAIFSMPEGTVFAMGDLEHLVTYDALRKTLSRYATAGYIERIVQGIYRTPSSTPVESIPEADIVAALARNSGWRVIPGTELARNQLGLYAKMPDYYLYFSTGPSYSYTYGKGKKIRLQHYSSKFLTSMSEKSALVTSALMDLRTYKVTPHEIVHLSNLLTEEEKAALMAERLYAPAKLRCVFEIICGQYGTK